MKHVEGVKRSFYGTREKAPLWIGSNKKGLNIKKAAHHDIGGGSGGVVEGAATSHCI